MYLAQRLLYVEMHKTGSTHIVDLLERTVPGRRMGKHNRPRTYPADRLIVTSVRNPWDWYLSLWNFGCHGLGALQERLTARAAVAHRGGPSPAPSPTEWRALYADANDPARFRSWLQCVHDPAHAPALGEGYEQWPCHGDTGFFTFRFLRFALDDPLRLEPATAGGATAAALYAHHRRIDRVIRTEHLSTDLLATLEEARCAPDEAGAMLIRRGDDRPANAGGRGATARFYDVDSVRLVAERERVLVDAFDYEPPDV